MISILEMKFLIALTAVLSLASNYRTQALQSTYVGAVVEYSPVFKSVESEMVNENVKNYVSLIGKAASKKADIVVFPEGGLNAEKILTEIPDPLEEKCPCDDPSNGILKQLSCAAKGNRIYAVINLPEKRNCTKDDEDCPEKGFFKYNTNVVFDRRGVVVARYAKYNLYDEVDTDKPKTAEMSFFETDFGVRFGTFICFDILFWDPTLRYIEQYGITDFVMTTYWFSELPFLSATQTQKGWAESNDVNLLVAGYNKPEIGSFGSGIYNGRFGALISTMPEVKTTKVLVANIPKKRRQDFCATDSCNEVRPQTFGGPIVIPSFRDNSGSSMNFGKDQMFRFKSKVIDHNKVFVETICAEEKFCCNFRVSTTLLNRNKTSYHYRAMVMDGVRFFGKSFSGGVQSCGVVLCNGSHIQNCSSRVPDIAGVIRVNEIKIEGKNFELRNSFQMASTLTDNGKLDPLPSHKYLFEKKNGESNREITMELDWPVSDLKTFGIWGRVFKRDGEPGPVSKAPSLTSVSWLLLLVLSSSLVFSC